MDDRFKRYVRVALSVAGSAILLIACESASGEDNVHEETLMTEYSEHFTMLMSENGRRSYHFTAPQVEGYSLAREPYREFRRGVKIITYQDDSLSTVDATLVANYAIYYENRKLWEAKGDVVVEKSDGKTLYTQQLFWNSTTGKIYSNVDSKIVQNAGTDVFVGEGFESDEEFKDWRFRRMKGRMTVNVAPTEPADSAATAATAATAASATAAAAAPEKPAAEKPAAGKSVPNKSAANKSAARKSVANKPAANESAAGKPVPGESTIGKPVPGIPAADKPAIAPSAADRPAAATPEFVKSAAATPELVKSAAAGSDSDASRQSADAQTEQ